MSCSALLSVAGPLPPATHSRASSMHAFRLNSLALHSGVRSMHALRLNGLFKVRVPTTRDRLRADTQLQGQLREVCRNHWSYLLL